MKNLLLVFTLLAAFSLVTVAQNGKNATDKTSFYINEDGEVIETTEPIFNFNEEVWDFGEIEEGDKYTHDFVFTNIGTTPLIIKNVKASCGCTTPLWPKEPVLPGESGTISAVYNSKNRPGNFNKAITITSNAITPTQRLFIKGKVIKPEIQIEDESPRKTKSIVEELGGSQNN